MNPNKLKLLAIGALVLVVLVGIAYSWNRNAKSVATTPTETNKPQTLSAEVPKEDGVTLTDKGFEPASLTVKKGMAVRWTNKSTMPKSSVNSDDYPTNKLYPELNLGLFNVNSTLVHIFDKPGTYGYHNQFKPEQKGTIVVTE